jgi:hypothetical protein
MSDFELDQEQEVLTMMAPENFSEFDDEDSDYYQELDKSKSNLKQ